MSIEREPGINEERPRLFVWQPNGAGSLSFFVLARTEEQARRAVESEQMERGRPYDYEGWGTDYYTLAVYGENEVATNTNE